MQGLNPFRVMEIESSRHAIIKTGAKLVESLAAYRQTSSAVAFNGVQKAMGEYNDSIHIFNCDLAAARDDINDYVDTKPKYWCETAAAKVYQQWNAELEVAELGSFEIPDRPQVLNLHCSWIISKAEHLEMPPVRLDNLSELEDSPSEDFATLVRS
jgi:hypothetical protein